MTTASTMKSHPRHTPSEANNPLAAAQRAPSITYTPLILYLLPSFLVSSDPRSESSDDYLQYTPSAPSDRSWTPLSPLPTCLHYQVDLVPALASCLLIPLLTQLTVTLSPAIRLFSPFPFHICISLLLLLSLSSFPHALVTLFSVNDLTTS
jgi:hypothetical protein